MEETQLSKEGVKKVIIYFHLCVDLAGNRSYAVAKAKVEEKPFKFFGSSLLSRTTIKTTNVLFGAPE